MTKTDKKLSLVKASPTGEVLNVQMPLAMLEALEGSHSAFFGLCVETGRHVLETMMEADRTAARGPRGQHDSARTAVRGGSTRSAVTLGGRRIELQRPRARTTDGKEVVLPSFMFAADRDPIDESTLEAIAAGASSRKYRRTLDRFPTASTRARSPRAPYRVDSSL